MTAPPSQQFRQIGFSLQGIPGSPPLDFNFPIRPEELTVTQPSRLTVQSTLGGAWADSFDEGVASITMAGTCGWRGGPLVSGEDLFISLRDVCFSGWHKARADAVSQGQDPDLIKLYWTDSLDQLAAIVAPRSFTLRRSKTSPLLIRYNIQLLMLAPADGPGSVADEIINALSNPLRWLAAKLGLMQIVDQINTQIGVARAVLGAAAGAVSNFVNVGVQLIASITQIAGEVQGVFTGSILDIGITYSRAASTAFSVLADDDSLSESERLPVAQLSSSFNSAACAMANGFNQIDVFPDYTAVRGSSTCSATGGGDPASVFTVQNVSAFSYIAPSGPQPVAVTDDAWASLQALGFRADPIAMRGQQAQVSDLMRRAGNGVVVA
jgi:hypothetical protein